MVPTYHIEEDKESCVGIASQEESQPHTAGEGGGGEGEATGREEDGQTYLKLSREFMALLTFCRRFPEWAGSVTGRTDDIGRIRARPGRRGESA